MNVSIHKIIIHHPLCLTKSYIKNDSLICLGVSRISSFKKMDNKTSWKNIMSELKSKNCRQSAGRHLFFFQILTLISNFVWYICFTWLLPERTQINVYSPCLMHWWQTKVRILPKSHLVSQRASLLRGSQNVDEELLPEAEMTHRQCVAAPHKRQLMKAVS